jgi:acyl dehydratase
MVLESRDGSGDLVATTRQGTLYLGVPTDGADRPADNDGGDPLPSPPVDAPVTEHHIEMSAGAAHVYTECARIWNPIHTDVEVARAAGLPDIILHGTATLAHAVSTVVREEAGGDPQAVRRISGRFGAMVPLPSAITVRLLGRTQLDHQQSAVYFDVRNAQGAAAVDRGVVVLG